MLQADFTDTDIPGGHSNHSLHSHNYKLWLVGLVEMLFVTVSKRFVTLKWNDIGNNKLINIAAENYRMKYAVSTKTEFHVGFFHFNFYHLTYLLTPCAVTMTPRYTESTHNYSIRPVNG